MDPKEFAAMNVAYEILSSVFGYFPTEEGYEDMVGTQQRHMISDSAIIKQWNEFTHRDDEHQYMQRGEHKDARYTAKQWFGHKNQPIEETYWALDVGNVFHDILDSASVHPSIKIMEIVKDNGKSFKDFTYESLDDSKSATSLFTSVLDDDIRHSDWYDTLLVPLPDNMGGPIHFGDTYDELESLYETMDKLSTVGVIGDVWAKPKLYHAVMQFPIPINKTDYQGYIAVMPYEKGGITFSNMALLEIKESIDDDIHAPLNLKNVQKVPVFHGSLTPSFGENAFKKWEELRPENRYQSINKRII